MKTWRHDYPGGVQGQIVKTGQTYMASVIPPVPVDAAGRGAPPPAGANSFADAVNEANRLAGQQSAQQDWRQLPQDSDTVVEKQPDGSYNVTAIIALGRGPVRAGLKALDQAKQIAREALAPNGTTTWYRDYRDAADHLEPFD